MLAPPISPEMGESFIASVSARPRTIETYTRSLRQLFRYLAESGISRPCRDDIAAYERALREAGLRASTVQSYITAARLFFRWAGFAGVYPDITDHYKLSERPDREHKKDAFTAAQIKQILGSIDRATEAGLRDHALIALLTAAGLRTVEASRANVEDLRGAAGESVIFVQGKGRSDKGDFVRIDDRTEAILRGYIASRPGARGASPLFASRSRRNGGGRLSVRAIREIVKRRFREAGFDSERLTAHSLRHTAVTLAILAGRPLDEVQQFARHASFNTTQLYSHALEKMKNMCGEAIAAAIY